MRSAVFLLLCVATGSAAIKVREQDPPVVPKRTYLQKFLGLFGLSKTKTPTSDPDPVVAVEWSCESVKGNPGHKTTWKSNRKIRNQERSVTFFGDVRCTTESLDNDNALNEMFDIGAPPSTERLHCHADDGDDSSGDGQQGSSSSQSSNNANAAREPIVTIFSPEGWEDQKKACVKAKEFHSAANSWQCSVNGDKAIYKNMELGSVTFEGLSNCVNLPIQVKLNYLFTDNKDVCEDKERKPIYICQTTEEVSNNKEVFKSVIVPEGKNFMILNGCDKAAEYHKQLSDLKHH